jgi:hypothetical protein
MEILNFKSDRGRQSKSLGSRNVDDVDESVALTTNALYGGYRDEQRDLLLAGWPRRQITGCRCPNHNQTLTARHSCGSYSGCLRP